MGLLGVNASEPGAVSMVGPRAPLHAWLRCLAMRVLPARAVRRPSGRAASLVSTVPRRAARARVSISSFASSTTVYLLRSGAGMHVG